MSTSIPNVVDVDLEDPVIAPYIVALKTCTLL
jgi:hypothetical protein